jgi:F420-0:gamma-glutamyl ligase
MSLTVSPLVVERKENEFDLFNTVIDSIDKNGFSLEEGDVLVISSKFVSNAQGRVIQLDSVKASSQSNLISKKFRMKPEFAEVIIRESDKIFGGISGFVISSSDNILAPNAGIDKSNAKKGKVILYPNEPIL